MSINITPENKARAQSLAQRQLADKPDDVILLMLENARAFLKGGSTFDAARRYLKKARGGPMLTERVWVAGRMAAEAVEVEAKRRGLEA